MDTHREYLESVKDCGQATIEFLICSIFAIGMIFMFISLSLNLTSGYMVHLATFMAGRVYLVSDNYSLQTWDDHSVEQATDMFKSYKVETTYMVRPVQDTESGRPGGLFFNKLSASSSSGALFRRKKLMVGPYFTFGQKLFYSIFGGSKLLTLTSAGFLGKEPTRHECKKRICETMANKIGYVGGCETLDDAMLHVTFYDNGC